MDLDEGVPSTWKPHAPEVKLWLKHNVHKVVITLLLLAAYLYNVGWNIAEYQRGRQMVKFIASNGQLAHFPPVTLCTTPPFHPLRLVPFGLNISADTAAELENRISYLTGVNRELSAGQLLDGAGWQIQDLVQELQIGDIILSPSNDGQILSKLWRRSFSPGGPCLEISAPADAILYGSDFTVTLREKPPDLQPCSWVVENSVEDFSNPEICSYIERNCNRSCVWEKYIQSLEYFYFFFIPSVYSSYDITTSAFGYRIDSGMTLTLHPYEMSLDSSLSKGYPPQQCFNRAILEKLHEHGNCLPLIDGDVLTEPLESVCVTGAEVYSSYLTYYDITDFEKYHLQHTCRPYESELRWKLDTDDLAEGKPLKIILILASSVTPTWHVTAAYPLHKLLEDTGGTLGLFLGLSLIDLGSAVFEFLLSLECVSRRTKLLNNVLKLCGIIFLAAPFCIQCVINIGSYISDTPVTSVTMAYPYGVQEIQSQAILSVRDAVSLHMASRPLGCQLLSLTTSQKCLFNCLFESVPLFPLCFKFLDDLPLCQNRHFGFPQMQYILPESFMSLESITDSLRDSCATKCSSFNSSVYLLNGKPVVNREYGSSFLSIACGFGGIVGLYFGLSLQIIPCAFQRSKVYTVLTNFSRKGSVFIMRVAAALICIILCARLFEKYFFSHPVYSDASPSLLQKSELPIITLCFWPPFNVEKLFAFTGSGTMYDDLNRLNSKERQDAILHFIQGLPGKNQTGEFHAGTLWENIAWTHEEFLVETNEWLRSFNKSIFNVCYSIDGSYIAPNSFKYNLYNTYFTWNASLYEGEVAVLAFIHRMTDYTPLGNDMIGVTEANKMKLKRVSRWFSMHGESAESGSCVLNCLDDILADQMQCALPWIQQQSHFRPCNITQFAGFLSTLWALKPNTASVYRELLGTVAFSKCREIYHSSSESFYSIQIDSIGLTTGNGFGLRVLPVKEFKGLAYYDLKMFTETIIHEIIEDVDGYRVPLLLSELGSIVGLTLGISLLSLVLKLVNKNDRR